MHVLSPINVLFNVNHLNLSHVHSLLEECRVLMTKMGDFLIKHVYKEAKTMTNFVGKKNAKYMLACDPFF